MAKKKSTHKIYKLGFIKNGEVKPNRKVYKQKESAVRAYELQKNHYHRDVCILEFELSNGKELIIADNGDLVPRTVMNNFIYG